MLLFEAYQDGNAVQEIDLAGAHVLGQDSIPVRADLACSDGQVSCEKKTAGACGLNLLWPAGKSGTFLLPTTRLPERKKPYNLNIELARAQMMRIVQKREDWGLFDFEEAKPLNDEFNRVRAIFVEALKTEDQNKASKLADKALAQGVTLGEKLAIFHANILSKRRASSTSPGARTAFGCSVDLFANSAQYQEKIKDSFDLLSLPMPWKHIEPKERNYQFDLIDSWINFAAQARKPICGGPLLSFEPNCLPDWLYIWEHDFETLRDLAYEHIQNIVQRYERQVAVWNVASGLHAYNNFNLNFEQLMELTRMSCTLVKKLSPRSQVLIELVMPWGEYYARNQRTIPPMLYADMAVQSGIKFDGFGVQLQMGVPVDGYYVRDLLQISAMLDEFVGLGKAVHITACQVPSDVSPDPLDAWEGEAPVSEAGYWHNKWSQRLQAEWLQAFYRIAMSKPYVECVTWRDLADYVGHHLPHSGLCDNNLEEKLAYKELRNYRTQLIAEFHNNKNNNHTKQNQTTAAKE